MIKNVCDQVIIESLDKKTIEMFDQENCIMVAASHLWLQVNTFPAGHGWHADGGTGNSSLLFSRSQ